GVVPLHDADAPALQILRRLDVRLAVDENISETKLAVGERRYRDMRQALGISAHARGEAAVPGIGLVFRRDELEIESLGFDGAVGDRDIGVDRRLAKIKAELGVGHRFLAKESLQAAR